MKKIFNTIKGFTLIELVITIAIFAAMTTYLLAKYGQFNQSILLTNLAYDIALTIRTAQSYGLNVKSVTTSTSDPSFDFPYGVYLDSTSSKNKTFTFFADQNSIDGGFGNGIYNPTPVDEKITAYSIKRGAIINELLACIYEGGNSAPTCEEAGRLDITFRRPDPDAIIFADGEAYIDGTRITYAEISVQSTDGIQKKIIIRATGQISIEDFGINGPDVE